MDVDQVTWISDILRSIFGLLDGIVFSLIKFVLYGVFDLSQISTNTEIFSNIYQRIYIVLGIFMAFKLSFSFFQYIINPDQLNGKGEGTLSKIIMRVFIMLGALVLLPNLLFGNGSSKGFLSRTQDAFLPMLPKLIFGANSSNGIDFSGDLTTTVDESADKIVAATLGGFFRPAEGLDQVCGPGSFKNTPPIENVDDFKANLNKKCMVIYYRYKYNFGISTIVGVLVLVLFLGITLSIAKRIFKLLILEVIAPIPIMSLIDPKGKDRAFEHWSKSLLNTFLDIFFKLGILYLVIVLIQLIVKANESGGIFENFPQRDGVRGIYLIVFLILGLIFFAKEAPKFIKDAIGIKDSGGGLFDDVKSVGKAAGLVGGAAIGVAGGMASGIVSANARYQDGQINGAHAIGSGLLGGIGGAIAGGFRGGSSGLSGAGKSGNPLKGWQSAIDKQNAVTSGKLSNAMAGSTWLGRREAQLSNFFTGRTAADRDESRISAYKGAVDAAKEFKSKLSDAAGKSNVGFKIHGKDNVTLRGFKSTLAAANSGDAAALSALNTTYGFSSLAEATNSVGDIEKEYQKAYYAAIQSGVIDAKTDGDASGVMSAKAVADRSLDGLGLKDMSDKLLEEVTASNAGAIIGAATLESNRIKSSSGYKSRKRNAEAVKRKK